MPGAAPYTLLVYPLFLLTLTTILAKGKLEIQASYQLEHTPLGLSLLLRMQSRNLMSDAGNNPTLPHQRSTYSLASHTVLEI